MLSFMLEQVERRVKEQSVCGRNRVRKGAIKRWRAVPSIHIALVVGLLDRSELRKIAVGKRSKANVHTQGPKQPFGKGAASGVVGNGGCGVNGRVLADVLPAQNLGNIEGILLKQNKRGCVPGRITPSDQRNNQKSYAGRMRCQEKLKSFERMQNVAQPALCLTGR
jgi:hypothetical protein